MTNKFKFFYRLDPSGFPIPGTLEKRTLKPSIGKWKELVVVDPCCGSTPDCPTFKSIAYDATDMCPSAFTKQVFPTLVILTDNGNFSYVIPEAGSATIAIPEDDTDTATVAIIGKADSVMHIDFYNSIGTIIATYDNTTPTTVSTSFALNELDHFTISCVTYDDIPVTLTDSTANNTYATMTVTFCGDVLPTEFLSTFDWTATGIPIEMAYYLNLNFPDYGTWISPGDGTLTLTNVKVNCPDGIQITYFND